jgi:hypothetical protein
MIPYLLAVLGGYLIGDSAKEPKKFRYGGTVEYAVRVYAIEPDTSNRHTLVFDVEADSQDEAMEQAKKMFQDDYAMDLEFENAEIVSEHELV